MYYSSSSFYVVLHGIVGVSGDSLSVVVAFVS